MHFNVITHYPWLVRQREAAFLRAGINHHDFQEEDIGGWKFSGLDSGKYGSNNRFRLFIIEHTVAGQKTEDHRPINKIKDNLSIHIVADFSPRNSPLPHGSYVIAPRLQKPLAEKSQESGVALALGNELAIQPACMTGVEMNQRLELLRKVFLR